MATINKRVNVSFPPVTGQLISMLAKRDHVSQSKKVHQLVEEALDIEEDMILGRIAQERDVPGSKFVPHDKFWADVLNRVPHKGKRRRS
jgi:hypothetical protein